MLPIDLKGKKVFIAGIADDAGFGWAIAKLVKIAGGDVIIGVWPPAYKIFTTSLQNGKFDESRKLPNGELLEFTKIYPLDAAYDTPEDVPSDIKENKRYSIYSHYTIAEVAEQIQKDFGTIDMIVHSLANAPEVKKTLLETSRKGYLSALSTSSYSLISFAHHFAPFMNPHGAMVSLTYIASTRVVPGYGGGMSSSKAALESDTRTLAWEVNNKWKEKQIRINTISAGPLPSRAARAIGMIEDMITFSEKHAPLSSPLRAEEVATTAVFLLSSLASAITGSVIYVDKGLHIMHATPQ